MVGLYERGAESPHSTVVPSFSLFFLSPQGDFLGLPLSDIVLFCFDDDESVFSSSFAYNVSFLRERSVFSLYYFFLAKEGVKVL